MKNVEKMKKIHYREAVTEYWAIGDIGNEQIFFFNNHGDVMSKEDMCELLELLFNTLADFPYELHENFKQEYNNKMQKILSQEFDLNENAKGDIVGKKKNKREGYVYFVQDDQGRVKIGKAIDVEARMGEYTQLPVEPILLNAIKVEDYTGAERLFHEYYKEYRMRGEWFQIPHKEVKKIKTDKYCYEIISKTT